MVGHHATTLPGNFGNFSVEGVGPKSGGLIAPVTMHLELKFGLVGTRATGYGCGMKGYWTTALARSAASTVVLFGWNRRTVGTVALLIAALVAAWFAADPGINAKIIRMLWSALFITLATALLFGGVFVNEQKKIFDEVNENSMHMTLPIMKRRDCGTSLEFTKLLVFGAMWHPKILCPMHKLCSGEMQFWKR